MRVKGCGNGAPDLHRTPRKSLFEDRHVRAVSHLAEHVGSDKRSALKLTRKLQKMGVVPDKLVTNDL